MKCDFCLEEVQEGAAACPHCTREQLWSIEARRKRRFATVATVLGVAIVGFAAFLILGKIASSVDKAREVSALEKEGCPAIVSAGWYPTVSDCVNQVDRADAKFYISTVNTKCLVETETSDHFSEDVKTCMSAKMKQDRDAGLTFHEAAFSH